MSAVIFFTVILAAALHAAWNAMVKSGKDKYHGTAAVVIGQAGSACIWGISSF